MHYIKYFTQSFTGVVFENSQRFCVEDRDPLKVKTKGGIIAFQFYELNSRKKEKNLSPVYFPDAKIYTLEEIRDKFKNGEEDTLISNMETNKWDKIIWGRGGHVVPWDSTFEIIEEKNLAPQE